jgi:hypothetical protein
MYPHAEDRTGTPQALLRDPTLQALLARTIITIGRPASNLDVAVPGPGHVLMSPALAERAGGRVLLRFALEHAWMAGIAGVPSSAAKLLAARATGCFLYLLPRAERLAALEDPAIPVFAQLASPAADSVALLFAWRQIVTMPPDSAALAVVHRLWPFAAPLEALLTGGGDDRLTLDPVTGRNRYLCPPHPEPAIIALGSCTASSPSAEAFAAAEQRRQALFAHAAAAGGEAALRDASRHVTEALLAHFQVADLAQAVLAASGTDATLLLTGLLAAEHPDRQIETILMSPSETGSGVPDAVLGQHFAPCTASGAVVVKGGAIQGFPPALTMTTISLRGPEGLPRDAAALSADCESAIAAIATKGGHAVLHAIDGSKTGLMGPDRAVCQQLAGRFGSHLDVVVDACQARIEPEIMRWYLEQGFPVLVTGSKFFAAPGFCGAILFPRARLHRIAGGGRLPDGLHAYAELTEDGISRRCPGLMLRWAAALEEMRRFGAEPYETVRASLDTLGGQIRGFIMRDNRLRLIPAPRPDGAGWSDRPSVFAFAVRGTAGWMSPAGLRPIYAALNDESAAGPRCRIGQPVEIAPGLGALRIALSAAQLRPGTDLRPELNALFGKLHVLLDSFAPCA